MQGYYVRRMSDTLAHYGVKGMKWGVRKTPILRPITLGKTGVQGVVEGAETPNLRPTTQYKTGIQGVVEGAAGGLEAEKMAKAVHDITTDGFVGGLTDKEAQRLKDYIDNMNSRLADENRISFVVFHETDGSWSIVDPDNHEKYLKYERTLR